MIIRNGKRIDGVSLDTTPIGTISPYLGVTAPQGYLLCQGQKVSKIRYKQLYNICKSLFGAETDTEFYLPDLRGKTITGYKNGDNTFGTLGGIIGALTHTHSIAHTHGVPGVAHTHTTGNHTLTIAEMPNHTHQVYRGTDGSSYFGLTGKEPDGNTPYTVNTTATGGSQPHNHGNTGSTTPSAATTNSQSTTSSGSASTLQPSMNLNWIVKAEMIVENGSKVYNGLDSSSTVDALSAAQGKILNTKISSLAKVATSGSYNDLSNKPVIPIVNNATLTIQKNGSNVATFTSNSSTNVTANISVPTITDTYSSTSTNGMSGKAVASAVSAVSNKLNFNKSEIEIGTWDGKKAYRKIIIQAYSTTTGSFTVNTGLSNVSIFNIYGTYIGSSYTIPINFSNDGKICFCHSNAKGTTLTCNNPWEVGTIHVVLEYVKN